MSPRTLLAIGLAAALVALVAAYYVYTASWGQGGGPGGQPGEPGMLAAEIARKKREGYATELAEYYAARARYYAGLGMRGEMAAALREAWRAIREAPRAKPVNDTEWLLVGGALGVEREPTAWDFVPLGRVFVEAPGGWLTYPGNDRRWVLSCFIIAVVAETPDGRLVAYQGRLPLSASESLFTPRIYIGGEWHVPKRLVFAGPLCYDQGGRYGGPAVYEHDLTGRFTEYIVYIPSEHLWRHAIVADNGTKLLELEIRGDHVMWISDWRRGLVLHGVYPGVKGFDAWGGFWVLGPANITLRIGGREVRVKGYAVFDRASHRSYPSALQGRRGAPVSFTCMVAWAPGFTMAVSQAVNPSPATPPGPMEHQAKIWVGGREYRLSGYRLEDDDGLQPGVFRLYAAEGGVEVNLTGRVFMYWPPKWPGGKGTWWGSGVPFTWGRAFLRWRGYVAVGGERIPVDAVGVAEMTRAVPGPAPSTGKCGCWG